MYLFEDMIKKKNYGIYTKYTDSLGGSTNNLKIEIWAPVLKTPEQNHHHYKYYLNSTFLFFHFWHKLSIFIDYSKKLTQWAKERKFFLYPPKESDRLISF